MAEFGPALPLAEKFTVKPTANMGENTVFSASGPPHAVDVSVTEFGPALPLAKNLTLKPTSGIANLWDHYVDLQNETFSRVCKGKSLPNSFAFSRSQNGKNTNLELPMEKMRLGDGCEPGQAQKLGFLQRKRSEGRNLVFSDKLGQNNRFC